MELELIEITYDKTTNKETRLTIATFNNYETAIDVLKRYQANNTNSNIKYALKYKDFLIK